MKYKGIKEIINGIANSFSGRNNDVNGYWAIGQLYTVCIENNVSSLSIDILNPQNNDLDSKFRKMSINYYSKLTGYLENYNLTTANLRQAIINLSFNPSVKNQICSDNFLTGDQFITEVIIVDDRGKKYWDQFIGYCNPHNPKVERRRGSNYGINTIKDFGIFQVMKDLFNK